MTDRSKPAFDANGDPVVDPTKNVLDLVNASVSRLDDLREENGRRVDAELEHVRAIVNLRSEFAALRAEHQREIRESESKRLDAIRQVDVTAATTAATTAADRALQAIQVLAATTQANAETLRAMVSNTAQTIATQTAGTISGIVERIANLEKSSYTGQGRQTIADPQLAQLLTEMQSLRSSQIGTHEKAEGKTAMWGYVVGAVGLLLTLVTIFGSIYAMTGK